MYVTMRFRQIPASAWFLWAIACLVFIAAPAVEYDGNVGTLPALTDVVTHDPLPPADTSCLATSSSSSSTGQAPDATDVEGDVDHGRRGGYVDPLSVAAADGSLASAVRSAIGTPGARDHQSPLSHESRSRSRLALPPPRGWQVAA